ncbi:MULTISPECIES: cytochrome c [unclassified Ensifer]|uniref:cytochrome c n=1 Tax=unclassified Ensifer TaxID=2633371 RepID=UPI000A4736B0|nr:MULTISPECIES: cytochrome c [unclassified Ensifer]
MMVTSRQHCFSVVLSIVGVTMLLSAYTTNAEEAGGQPSLECTARYSLAAAIAVRPTLNWADIRGACDAALAKAKSTDPIGHSWFVNAGNGFVGVPLVLLKVLPDLSPEIWGPPEEFYSRFGLFPDPDLPQRILPRGLGITGAAGRPLDHGGRPTGEIDYNQPQPLFVTLACGACHTGKIDLGDRQMVIDGAPNTQFDVRKWRAAFSTLRESYLADAQVGTTAAPGDTTRKLIELIESKPKGFFSRGLPNIAAAQIEPVDAAQRAIFTRNAVQFLTGLAQSTAVRAAAVALQVRSGSSYGHDNRSPGLAGFSAGQSDGSGDLLADLITDAAAREGKLQELLKGPLPEALPRFATVTDAPAVWNQADRVVGQWDGSVLEPYWRNIAAQLPIVGQPQKVDLMNAGIVSNFLMGLPAAPYPFDVNMTKAVRGEAIFAENCGACHRPRNEQRYPQIGTDMNRAQVLNTAGSAIFLTAFKAACHDASFRYTDPYGRQIQPCAMPDFRILRDTTEVTNQGYLASPLDGIWARAPYLHNGSVPTLAHLLQPGSRPETFLRGVIEFDPKVVGWVWDAANLKTYSLKYPTVSVHDTKRDGWSNRGHDRDLVIEGKLHRLDWSDPARAGDFDALIEYLKTL